VRRPGELPEETWVLDAADPVPDPVRAKCLERAGDGRGPGSLAGVGSEASPAARASAMMRANGSGTRSKKSSSADAWRSSSADAAVRSRGGSMGHLHSLTDTRASGEQFARLV
jgi:hypothetical protein